MDQRFPKIEKLKSSKLIEKIFVERKGVSKYPLKVFFTESPYENVPLAQAGFSVSKRNFKKAVDRNRIKRLMREAYRLQKTVLFNNLSTPHAFMFLYLGKEEPDYKLIETTMEQLLIKFLEKTCHL
ncbi:ribonuclease P protein component [Ascidiimonas sp. W6]|uniref:ribonuclease P protein component n=1 Tax=Ascidiimonas meishanensis TaxID=3128903 RepID=UPI0030EC4BCF